MHNLTRILDYNAQARPDAEALVYGDVRLSWRDLRRRVHATAGGLKARGIGPDMIVAMMMKNSAAFIELVYAISHLGAVCLPINFRLSSEEVDYITRHAGAALILADTEFRGAVDAVSRPVELIDQAGQRDSTAIFGGEEPVAKALPRQGCDLLRLMYTSGTTDRPKGVMHSYDNFYWKCLDHVMALGLDADERLGVVGPLYHVGGSDLPGLGVHLAGGTIVVQRDFDPAAVLDMIAKERITGIWLAPVMTAGLLTVQSPPDTSSLKWCIGGGEKTPESRIREFGRFFPNARYIDAYGMTETVSGDTLMEPGREIEKIGSVGRTLRFVDIEIRDDDGRRLPAGEIGEICIAGPKVTRGYWKDPDKTAQSIHPDGFLKSGDVGYYDEDGFLYLTDRKKDMIISGGENIASSEVERVLHTMPEVLDVAVIGKPHEKWGEVVVAVIVPRDGMDLAFDRVDRHCRDHLAGFKCPKELVILAELPRNPSGKILKRVLREKILAGT